VPEANKIIGILKSERSFGKVIREIQVNFQSSETAHWYDTWLGSYNSSGQRFESTPGMINVVFLLFICFFIYLLVCLVLS
jgi:hypothetical protein